MPWILIFFILPCLWQLLSLSSRHSSTYVYYPKPCPPYGLWWLDYTLPLPYLVLVGCVLYGFTYHCHAYYTTPHTTCSIFPTSSLLAQFCLAFCLYSQWHDTQVGGFLFLPQLPVQPWTHSLYNHTQLPSLLQQAACNLDTLAFLQILDVDHSV